MNTVNSVEAAYRILAQDILRFINGRAWDSAGANYGVYSSMVSSEWWVSYQGVRNEGGGADSSIGDSKEKSAAVRYLRDDLLATTGDRIWGLTFTLFPDGKIKIEYDYNKPADYEETDEVITGEEINQSLNDLFRKQ